MTKMADASTGGHLAQDPGRIAGKTGEGESTSSELPSSTRHQRQHQLRRSYRCCRRRCGIRSGERNPQRERCSHHGISFMSFVIDKQPGRQWSQIYMRALFNRAWIQRHHRQRSPSRGGPCSRKLGKTASNHRHRPKHTSRGITGLQCGFLSAQAAHSERQQRRPRQAGRRRKMRIGQPWHAAGCRILICIQLS